MDSFKLFVENYILGFVQEILQRRTDRDLRLINADWLEEQGDALGTFIRAAHIMGQTPRTDPRFNELNKAYHAAKKQTDANLESQNVYVNYSNGEVTSMPDKGVYIYRIQGNQIAYHSEGRNDWMPVKNLAKLHEPILKGFIALFAFRMAQYRTTGMETSAEFRTSNREFFEILDAVERRWQYSGSTYRMPAAGVQRFRRAIDHILRTLDGASQADRQNLINGFHQLLRIQFLPQDFIHFVQDAMRQVASSQ